MTKPMFGMKLVTNARIAQTTAAGTPSAHSARPSMTATMRAEGRADDEVAAHADG